MYTEMSLRSSLEYALLLLARGRLNSGNETGKVELAHRERDLSTSTSAQAERHLCTSSWLTFDARLERRACYVLVHELDAHHVLAWYHWTIAARVRAVLHVCALDFRFGGTFHCY